jgi:hypothetical protein
LKWVGYTFDDEGVPQRYDEFLTFAEVDFAAFGEYHFKQRADMAPGR